MAGIKICPVCGAPVTFHERRSVSEWTCWLEAQSPRWISVEERLPEDCEDVLVRIARGDASRIVCAWLLNGEWRYLNVRCDGDRVTHWMPLPEPPEEDE